MENALEELQTQHHDMLGMEIVPDLAAGFLAISQDEEALALIVNALDVQERAGSVQDNQFPDRLFPSPARFP